MKKEEETTGKNLDEAGLAALTASTIGHYEHRAEQYRAGTWDHDVRQNLNALLRHIDAAPPYRILDLGCGPGRDLVALAALGHAPVGLDGAERFCQMARAASGCPVLHQDFLALELPPAEFHGVFANAALFHVPVQELLRVIDAVWRTLVRGGVFFASNPHGDNREGWQGERYGSYLDYSRWHAIVSAGGFVELEHYYRPSGEPRHRQPWLATVFRKPEA